MDLVKDKWTKEDVIKFDEYLYSLRRQEKINWTKNIVCTNMDTLAIVLPDLKKMAKEIFKGDYISYLNLMPHKYFETLMFFVLTIVSPKSLSYPANNNSSSE